MARAEKKTQMEPLEETQDPVIRSLTGCEPSRVNFLNSHMCAMWLCVLCSCV